MGGKRGQAQRTKNNAKPSSSGRCAELLGQEALTGFSSLKDNASIFNLNHVSAEVVDPNIDPNFVVVLKRMYKKDATTKHKALQEFITLCQTNKGDTVNLVIPSWVRVYRSLVMDTENRVREAAQQAHRAIVINVGRNLAPYLRQIAPFWLISQYDTYPPAATAATLSFQEAFPSKKMADVIAFCHADILSYITDNILNQTVQSLSKPGTNNAEEMEAKYIRVISSSFYGYSLYLKLLSKDKLEEFKEANKVFISSDKFWSFAKHQAPSVRAAWFSNLISLCQHAFFLLEDKYKNAVESVFNNLDESDPTVLPVVWEATLHVLVVIKEWWEHLNTKKSIFSKLFNILNQGGQGTAAIIYPHLLPLLSSLPAALIPDKLAFYKKFFNCLQFGSKQQSVTNSPSESEAVASAYIECIRYIFMINISDVELLSILLHDHLINLVNVIMTDRVHRHFVPYFFQGLSQLIHYWHKSSLSNKATQKLLADFWTSIPSLFVKNLSESTSDIKTFEYVLKCQFLLFEALKCPKITTKKKHKVKFASDNFNSENESETKLSIKEFDEEPDLLPELKEQLFALMKELSNKYLRIALDCESTDCKIHAIGQMWRVSKLLGSEKGSVFMSMMTGEDEFYTTLLGWLRDDSIPLKPLLGLIFNSFSCLENEKFKDQFLNNITEMRLKEAIVEAVKLSTEGYEYEIQMWLRSDSLRETLCNYVLDLSSEKCNESAVLLQNCFTTFANGDFVVGNSTVLSILGKIMGLLKSDCSYSSKTISQLIDALLQNGHDSFFLGEHCNILFEILLISFDKLLLEDNEDLFNMWENGIVKLSQIHSYNSDLFMNHINLCAARLIFFFENNSTKSLTSINHVCKITYCCLRCAVEKVPSEGRNSAILDITQVFVGSVINNAIDKWQLGIEGICLSAEQVYGNFRLISEDAKENVQSNLEGKWDPLKCVNIIGYIESMVFCIKMLTLLLDLWNDPKPVSNVTEKELILFPKDLNTFSNCILNCSFGLSLFKTVSKYYKSTVQFFESAVYLEIFDKDLKELVQLLEASKHNEMILEIKQSRAGPQWKKTMELLCYDFLDLDIPGEDCNEIEGIEILTGKKLFNLRIEISVNKNFPKDKIIEFLKITTDKNNTELFVTYDKDWNLLTLENLIITTEIARFFNTVINNYVHLIESSTWDFIMVGLASWIQSISKTETHKYYKEFVAFVIAVSDLFISFSKCLKSNAENEKFTKIIKEWNDVFSLESHRIFSVIWESLAEKCSNKNMGPVTLLHVEKLSDVILYIVQNGTFLLTPSNTSSVLCWIKNCINFIVSSCPAVQITAFQVFLHLAPLMLDIDNGIDESCINKLSCNHIKPTFLHTQAVVQTLLQDFKVGVTCSVQPYTDSFTYTRSYLFLWLTLFKICELGESQLRYLYTVWIKENDIFTPLVNSLLRLMPHNVIHLLEVNVKKTHELFSNPPPLSYDGWTSSRLSHLSCWVYHTLLRTLPALARQWVADSDPKVSSLIDKLTTLFVSPVLCLQEMDHIKCHVKQFDNMKVLIHPQAREVVAVYSVEECATELLIQLSTNHPLSPPKVEISKAVISTNKTRQMLMQLTIFLTHQNGSILDSLILWKTNLDKKFEGVEECYICFSVIQNSNLQFPNISCQTCKKKFHSLCLYKWFTTSNKSTCPICRNLF